MRASCVYSYRHPTSLPAGNARSGVFEFSVDSVSVRLGQPGRGRSDHGPAPGSGESLGAPTARSAGRPERAAFVLILAGRECCPFGFRPSRGRVRWASRACIRRHRARRSPQSRHRLAAFGVIVVPSLSGLVACGSLPAQRLALGQILPREYPDMRVEVVECWEDSPATRRAFTPTGQKPLALHCARGHDRHQRGQLPRRAKCRDRLRAGSDRR